MDEEEGFGLVMMMRSICFLRGMRAGRSSKMEKRLLYEASSSFAGYKNRENFEEGRFCYTIRKLKILLLLDTTNFSWFPERTLSVLFRELD